jgi:phosphate/sulfate permease
MCLPLAPCLPCSRHSTTALVRFATFPKTAVTAHTDWPADDVANAWATSVSSRSVTYRQAMVLCLIFEMTGALAVGARTASTIKNGIIPNSAFGTNAGVQLLAFACASAGASIWVMWCTRNSAHVSSTYSLVSSIAGVGVATVGASKVQWGWSGGSVSGLLLLYHLLGNLCYEWSTGRHNSLRAVC